VKINFTARNPYMKQDINESISKYAYKSELSEEQIEEIQNEVVDIFERRAISGEYMVVEVDTNLKTLGVLESQEDQD